MQQTVQAKGAMRIAELMSAPSFGAALPPLLRRPLHEAPKVSAPAPAAVPERPRVPFTPAHPDDATIIAARDAAAEFIDSLPNFSARQTTTRYVMEGPPQRLASTRCCFGEPHL